MKVQRQLPERVPAKQVEVGDEISGRGTVVRIETDRNGIALCFEHAKPLTVRPEELVSRERRERRTGLDRRQTASRRWSDTVLTLESGPPGPAPPERDRRRLPPSAP